MSAKSADPKHAAAPSKGDEEDLFANVVFEEPSPGGVGASMRTDLEHATAQIDTAASAARDVSERLAGPLPMAVATPDSNATSTIADAARRSVAPFATLTTAEPSMKIGYGELAAWLLGAVALINVGIGIGSLTSANSKQDTSHATSEVAPETASATLLADTSAPLEVPARQGTPSDAKPEGYRTLELARARLDRGEWERARTMLYSQLAVVDGISEPARSDIEARADFLIAESYRLQAAAFAPTQERHE